MNENEVLEQTNESEVSVAETETTETKTTPPADTEAQEQEKVEETAAPDLDKLAKERDSYKKQAEDLRKKLSTNGALKSPEEYSAAYKPDEKYSPFLSEKESDRGKFIQEVLSGLNVLAKDNGLNANQANSIKNEFLGLLEDVGVIDTQSPEERQKEILTRQEEILGENAAALVKQNVDFVENFNIFTANEKAMLKLAATEGNPHIVSVLDKIRMLVGKTSTSDIPVNTSSDGLPSDERWLETYQNATDSEKLRLIKMRAEAGRAPVLSV